MANPTSTGIGQGSAQIFDTTGVTNLYGQILQRRQLQDERDSQVTAELMRQYDPNKQGLRKDDLAEYNDLYTKYKNVYLQNKDLYRNPLKNQKAYNEANELASKMAALKTESVELSKVFGETGGIMAKNSSKFSETTKESFKTMTNLPVSKIKSMYGGRLPTSVDFEEYRPAVPYDKVFDGMVKDLDGASRFEEQGRMERWDSPAGKAYGIPEGKEARFATRKYKPEDVSQLSLHVVADQQIHDNIQAELKDAYSTKEGQARLTELQQWYNTNYNPKGDGMQVNVTTPEGYLTASYLQKNGVKEIRSDKFTENADYAKKVKVQDEIRQSALSVKTHEKKVKISADAQKEVSDYKAKNAPATDEENLDAQAETILKALESGADNEDAMVNLNAAYDDNKKIKFISKTSGESLDDFKERVRDKKGLRVVSGDLSDDELEAIYKDGKGAYIVERGNNNVIFKGTQNKKELAARLKASLLRTPKTTKKGLSAGTIK